MIFASSCKRQQAIFVLLFIPFSTLYRYFIHINAYLWHEWTNQI